MATARTVRLAALAPEPIRRQATQEAKMITWVFQQAASHRRVAAQATVWRR